MPLAKIACGSTCWCSQTWLDTLPMLLSWKEDDDHGTEIRMGDKWGEKRYGSCSSHRFQILSLECLLAFLRFKPAQFIGQRGILDWAVSVWFYLLARTPNLISSKAQLIKRYLVNNQLSIHALISFQKKWCMIYISWSLSSHFPVLWFLNFPS